MQEIKEKCKEALCYFFFNITIWAIILYFLFYGCWPINFTFRVLVCLTFNSENTRNRILITKLSYKLKTHEFIKYEDFNEIQNILFYHK